MTKMHDNLYSREEIAALELPEPTIEIRLPRFFGQCGDDYLCLSMIRALATKEGLNLENERYCEVGAFHPVAGSATYLLHVGLGMTGVLVEANPALVPNLVKARPHDTVRNLAIVPGEETEASLFYGTELELSSLDRTNYSRFYGVDIQPIGSHRVQAQNLSRFMDDEFSKKAPLLLSLDIEGLDCAVLESYDFAVRPYLIQIEASEDYDRDTYLRISRALEAHRYQIVQRTDVNQIAVDLDRFLPDGRLQSLPFGSVGMDAVLEGVKILSLDIFDTVLARRCLEPVDVFRWIERKFDLPGFAQARVVAESVARERHAARGSEVSLDEIYAELDPSYADSVMEHELQTECLFLYANPSITALIARARRQGCRVIAVSDIYLSPGQVDLLLRGAGVVLDKVYTSSDLRQSDLGKYNGRIYPHVLGVENVRPEEVLHVGDNWQSDILNAQTHGLRCLETKQLHAIALRHDPYMSRIAHSGSTLAGSVILGQLARRRATVASKLSAMEEFGYDFGGPMLAGFAAFLIAQAKECGIDRLLLLERDGTIVAEALDILQPNGLTYRRVPASRRLAVFPLSARDGFDAVRSFFTTDRLSEAEFFSRLLLPSPSREPREQARKFSPEILFDRHAGYLQQLAKDETAAIRAELEADLALAKEGHRLAWVDVGWALSSVAALNRLLEADFPCFCLGSNAFVGPDVSDTGYLFTRLDPARVGNVVMQAVEPLEMLFTSTEPSVAYLQQSGAGLLPVYRKKTAAELVRDAYVTEIRKGALAFVKDAVDLLGGIDLEDLRQFNRVVAETVLSEPNPAFFEMMAKAPHDRLAGASGWSFVGDYWKVGVRANAQQPGTLGMTVAGLRTEVERLRCHPLHALSDLIKYRVLLFAARLAPPIPRRMAARFARSAAKRDPMR